ncbi:hypothetical protein IKE72_00325 [Candidatus Saccharibacteria bacterium]|nr:hypothetical protein [Candidatus Saccharibacteria bacterium]
MEKMDYRVCMRAQGIFYTHQYAAYMDYTGGDLAREHGLPYVFSGYDVRIADTHQEAKKFSLYDGRTLPLYPPVDGKNSPRHEYYTRLKGEMVKVMDNESAYTEITNLPEILVGMVLLYINHINDPVFMDASHFAVELIDPVTAGYHGRGRLAVTDRTVINHLVKPDQMDEARYTCYNDFLDHFIGWNFGVPVSGSSELRSVLQILVALMHERGIRGRTTRGLDVWMSPHVWQVKYSPAGDISVHTCNEIVGDSETDVKVRVAT